MLIGLDFMGFDFVCEVDYDVTSWGAPETGPTYSCGGQPAEPPEWEIESIILRREIPGGLGPIFEATGALFDCLANLDCINDAIAEEIWTDGPPEPDWD